MKKLILSLILTQSLAVFAAGEPEAIQETIKTFTTHDGLTLRGKVAYPQTMSGKRPAVLLIHGMGPFDMNSYLSGQYSATGQPHKPFETIARALGEKGIISFRYNKRGITDQANGGPIVNNAIYDAITLDALIKDASAALKILKSDSNVDQNKIIVLGISQGTMIAPQVVKSVGGVAALVLMSSIGQYDNNSSAIAKLKLPVLLQHGDIDTITPLSEAHLIVKALENAGSTSHTLKVYSGLGHGFSPNRTGGFPTLGPLNTGVVNDIPAWINSRFIESTNKIK